VDRSELPPEDQAYVREKARRMVGLGVLHQIQLWARKYQEEEAFKRRAAKIIAIACAVLVAGCALLVLTAPGVLQTVFRLLS
jgi:hypothetical protein